VGPWNVQRPLHIPRARYANLVFHLFFLIKAAPTTASCDCAGGGCLNLKRRLAALGDAGACNCVGAGCLERRRRFLRSGGVGGCMAAVGRLKVDAKVGIMGERPGTHATHSLLAQN